MAFRKNKPLSRMGNKAVIVYGRLKGGGTKKEKELVKKEGGKGGEGMGSHGRSPVGNLVFLLLCFIFLSFLLSLFSLKKIKKAFSTTIYI